MSVISPWGFGVNRREIEILLREIVRAVTGLADDRVLIVDQGARTPESPRPFVGIDIGEPVGPYPSWGERRPWPTLEAWTVTVTDASDSTYTVTVLGTDYSFVAASSSITAIRDGLVAAMGVPVGFSVASVGTDQLTITSTVVGQSLVVSATPATLEDVRTKSAYYERRLEQVELQVDFECNGLLSLTDPLPTQSGHHYATLIQSALNNPSLTQKMRGCGHVPVRVNRISGPDILQGQQLSQDFVQLVLRTTSRMDVQVDPILSIPLNQTLVQM